MTSKEFGMLADAIKTYFPRDNMLSTQKSMELWFDMLKDLDYRSAAYGLKKYVALNKFPPAISDIRQCAVSINEPEELNESEAWALVRKAIGNSVYNSTEEFLKLPPLAQKAVGLPGQLRIWAMDEDYNEGVVSSNFLKAYRTAKLRHEEDKKIPLQVKKLIEKANDTRLLQSSQRSSDAAEVKQQARDEIIDEYATMIGK